MIYNDFVFRKTMKHATHSRTVCRQCCPWKQRYDKWFKVVELRQHREKQPSKKSVYNTGFVMHTLIYVQCFMSVWYYANSSSSHNALML